PSSLCSQDSAKLGLMLYSESVVNNGSKTCPMISAVITAFPTCGSSTGGCAEYAILSSPPSVASVVASSSSAVEVSSESESSDPHAIKTTAINATSDAVKNRLKDISIYPPLVLCNSRMQILITIKIAIPKIY